MRLSQALSRPPFNFVKRHLTPNEQLQYGDFVEDIEVGDIARAEKGTFYGSLVGLTVGQIKQLPQVYGVVREELE